MRKPELEIYRKRIKVKDEAKFLGVIFDRKLSVFAAYKSQKKMLRSIKCFQDLLSPEWGGGTEILLQLYSSFALG